MENGIRASWALPHSASWLVSVELAHARMAEVAACTCCILGRGISAGQLANCALAPPAASPRWCAASRTRSIASKRPSLTAVCASVAAARTAAWHSVLTSSGTGQHPERRSPPASHMRAAIHAPILMVALAALQQPRPAAGYYRKNGATQASTVRSAVSADSGDLEDSASGSLPASASACHLESDERAHAAT